jgi:hypothetical protein
MPQGSSTSRMPGAASRLAQFWLLGTLTSTSSSARIQLHAPIPKRAWSSRGNMPSYSPRGTGEPIADEGYREAVLDEGPYACRFQAHYVNFGFRATAPFSNLYRCRDPWCIATPTPFVSQHAKRPVSLHPPYQLRRLHLNPGMNTAPSPPQKCKQHSIHQSKPSGLFLSRNIHVGP